MKYSAVALSHADMWNATKIKLSWPELWEEYLNFEKPKEQADETKNKAVQV